MKHRKVERRRLEATKLESVPFAPKSFSELGLPSPLIERLESGRFNVPTNVQSAAIPTILKNHDVVIQLYTGLGKTLAYVLPILCEVGPLKNKSSSGDKETRRKTGIEAVIVAPSRELGLFLIQAQTQISSHGQQYRAFLQHPNAILHRKVGTLRRSVHAMDAQTGRLGRKGTVVTICEEPEMFAVKKLQKQLGGCIPACEFKKGKLVVTEEEKKHAEALSFLQLDYVEFEVYYEIFSS
ncbi:hypothetical protein D5086_000912 [Populus alba]|uniref:Uncharacterized protein n=1 Tax=Populus alba TaxID=43335 RepID=A0ACC4CX84_POPAL